ncbi:hypothetical protein MICRO80W_310016 [Micrococcus luteus]|nr:hypothetical protein MICRO80W_310016 [Micrococcus luteus]
MPAFTEPRRPATPLSAMPKSSVATFDHRHIHNQTFQRNHSATTDRNP